MSRDLSYEAKQHVGATTNVDLRKYTARYMPESGWGAIEHVEGTDQMPHQRVRNIYGNFLKDAEELARDRATTLDQYEGVRELPDGGDIPDREVFFTVAQIERVNIAAEADISLTGIYRAIEPNRPQPE